VREKPIEPFSKSTFCCGRLNVDLHKSILSLGQRTTPSPLDRRRGAMMAKGLYDRA